MNKHTPGPWDFGWQIQPNGCPTVGHKGLMVCMVAHSAKDPDQKETALANASLIASAPDMFDALMYARRALELANFTGELAVVDAAIAKAKGLNPDQG